MGQGKCCGGGARRELAANFCVLTTPAFVNCPARQGLHTKVCQVAARCFGIDVASVHVSDTATDKVANASPTAASLSTDLYGMATLIACEEIKERLAPIAAKLPGADFTSVVQAAFFARVDLTAHGFYSLPTDR